MNNGRLKDSSEILIAQIAAVKQIIENDDFIKLSDENIVGLVQALATNYLSRTQSAIG